MCAATEPPEGWLAPLGPVGEALSRMHPTRQRWLRSRGLYVARVPIPPPRQMEHMQWIMQVPDVDLAGARWVIDGSLLDGPRRTVRRPGFSILLLSRMGTPLALALGTPPDWIHTANGAEGWALLQVLCASVGMETIYTDCKSLLDSLKIGARAATAASRTMARLWGLIFHQLDDIGSDLVLQDQERLVWLPAHTAPKQIGKLCMSNGQPVSTELWRGNRLVDAAAKLAAKQHTVDEEVLRALQTADSVAMYGAAMLGLVTHAANNFKVEEVGPDGRTRTRVHRDSAPLRTSTLRTTPAAVPAERQRQGEMAMPVTSDAPLARAAQLAAKRRLHADEAELRNDARFWANWSGPTLRARGPGEPTAADRLEALKRRVRMRRA